MTINPPQSIHLYIFYMKTRVWLFSVPILNKDIQGFKRWVGGQLYFDKFIHQPRTGEAATGIQMNFKSLINTTAPKILKSSESLCKALVWTKMN